MQHLDGSIGAAVAAMGAFARAAAADPGVPAATWAALDEYRPSAVDRIVQTAEALYAASTVSPAFPAAGLTLCAQLAHMCIEHQWHQLGQTDRGARMIAACRRRLGELDPAQAPAELDPEPLAEHLPPAEPDPEPAPPAE